MKSVVVWAAVIATVVLSACSAAPVSCRRDADCPAGEVCESSVCEPNTAAPDGGKPDAGTKPDGGELTRCTPGTECRARSGDCDIAEQCGADGFCPADFFLNSGTVCRAPAGPCDLDERCTGQSPECPTDRLAPTTTVCRSSGGLCDPAESCNGTSAQCPNDSRMPSGAVCRPIAGGCDVEERCDGTSLDCPADAVLAQGTSCRAATGTCDLEERCTGVGAMCPPDAIKAAGELCRAALNQCDVEERCVGDTKQCPLDMVQPSTLQCSPQECTAGVTSPARFCAGSSATCVAATTVSCNGYTCLGATCRTTCTSNDECLSTHSCQAGQCAPRRANGVACSGPNAGSECASGTCLGSYQDIDNDGFGAGPVGWFCGTTAPAGRSTSSNDCCDTDSRARPGQTVFLNTPRNGCGGYDFDCNGVAQHQYTGVDACQSVGECSTEDRECTGGTGWADHIEPGCGETATYIPACRVVTACSSFTCPSCTACMATVDVRTQACR
jgi:Cys-rich repeat protein